MNDTIVYDEEMGIDEEEMGIDALAAVRADVAAGRSMMRLMRAFAKVGDVRADNFELERLFVDYIEKPEGTRRWLEDPLIEYLFEECMAGRWKRDRL